MAEDDVSSSSYEKPLDQKYETQLSQEETVGWDEGCSVDLRRLASPTFRTPGTAQETPYSSSAPSNASSSSSSSGVAVRSRTTRKPRPSLSEITRIIAAQEVSIDTSDNAKDDHVSRKRRRRQDALRSMALATDEHSTHVHGPAAVTTTTAAAAAKPLTASRPTLPANDTSPTAAHIKSDFFADLLHQVRTPTNNISNAGETRAVTKVVDMPTCSSKANDCSAHETPLACNTKPSSKEKTPYVDEFGDMDFSMEDMAALDAMMEQTTQKENTVNHHSPVRNRSNTLAPALYNSILPRTAPEIQPDVADDEFGDFPADIDFEKLDKSVTQQLSQSCSTHNPLRPDYPSDYLAGCLSHSRYRVLAVSVDYKSFTKTLTVAAWRTEMLDDVAYTKSIHKADDFARRYPSSRKTDWTADGVIHLNDDWYMTPIENGDIIHVCSLSGQHRTDAQSLPMALHTYSRPGIRDNDLLLIVHPDMLLTPTVITEAVTCSRRAVLKSRLGSTGLTSEAPLFGTMRHQLFEATMKEGNFAIDFARKHVSRIVRENAEGLLACDMTPHEAEAELIKFVPQLQSFASQYTACSASFPSNKPPILESCGISTPIHCRVDEVKAIEEPIVSPELGLKGNIDMIVKASTGSVQSNHLQPNLSAMCVELKTSHMQRIQHPHVAQLALYMIMLSSRYATDHSESNGEHGSIGDIGDGMLLYMNNEAVRAVNSRPSTLDIKSLIGQRNTVAIETLRAARPRGVVVSYQNVSDLSDGKPSVNLLEPSAAALPLLHTDSHMCERCYVNRECFLYAATEAGAGTNVSHKDLLRTYTGNLQSDDLAYFQKFDRLIDLEADAEQALITQAWLIDSNDRQKCTSKCIASLTYDPDLPSESILAGVESSTLSISFKREHSCQMAPLNELGLESGALVIVSCDTTTTSIDNSRSRGPIIRHPMHLVRGIIGSISANRISIRASADDQRRIEKLIRTQRNDILFRVDKDDVATGVATLRQNLVNLFSADSNPKYAAGIRLQRLRDSVVRLRRPIFDASLQNHLFSPLEDIAPVPGCDLLDLVVEYAEMNSDQRGAIAAAFTARDFSLIQGFPGAGKTSTIAFIIRLFAAHGKRVLVTSYTNAAVDNVVIKLMEKGVAIRNAGQPSPALVRIGRAKDCHSGVLPVMTSTVAMVLENSTAMLEDDNMPTTPSATFLRRAVDSAKIVAVTALTAPRSSQLLNQRFDVVIVDEAGQISQPAVIGALILADTFVLVGDHMQLPPLVSSELAERGGYAISMLKHLADAHPDMVAKLSYQYRMNGDICQLSNDLVYNGALKCANDNVRDQRLEILGYPANLAADWLRAVLDPSMPVVYVNTDHGAAKEFEPLEKMQAGKIINEKEATLVRDIVNGLIQCGVDAKSIGVICPFRAQIQELNRCPSLAAAKVSGLEISTIDRYQGRDKAVIVLSFVRSNRKGKVGRLLEDFRRLNVAITRAKCKLIMVGSYSTILHGSEAFKLALLRLKDRNRVLHIPDTIPSSNSDAK